MTHHYFLLFIILFIILKAFIHFHVLVVPNLLARSLSLFLFVFILFYSRSFKMWKIDGEKVERVIEKGKIILSKNMKGDDDNMKRAVIWMLFNFSLALSFILEIIFLTSFSIDFFTASTATHSLTMMMENIF